MMPVAFFAVVGLCALALSVCVTGVMLVYARRRGLLDLPGRRRSHTLATPRGGGVGVVAAALLVAVPAWCLADSVTGSLQPLAFAAGVLAVALVGWRDDHASLAVLPRLTVHLAAAALVAAAAVAPWAMHDPRGWWALLVLVPLLAGFINAHNFMDGIDGLLGLQGLFVMAGLGLVGACAGEHGVAALAFAVAAGCVGFLMFNLPPARIFMGDVGSGALGLAIGAAATFLAAREPRVFWACAILPSTFLVDSGLTLLRRVVGRQRWYAPHRQHLYQWLVRVNSSHARTDVVYMLWNLVVVAPMAWLATRWPAHGAWCCAAAYVLAATAWYAGKRGCLAMARRSATREIA